MNGSVVFPSHTNQSHGKMAPKNIEADFVPQLFVLVTNVEGFS